MPLIVEFVDKKKRLLEESYVLIERLKKLRALNCNPRLVGINPRLYKSSPCKR
jgi:hypothetical protein